VFKGIAFDNFLGRTFRGELGQFFYTRTVVGYMVNIPVRGEVLYCCGGFPY
jgi:type I restriction enzyme M protein